MFVYRYGLLRHCCLSFRTYRRPFAELVAQNALSMISKRPSSTSDSKLARQQEINVHSVLKERLSNASNSLSEICELADWSTSQRDMTILENSLEVCLLMLSGIHSISLSRNV